jgi:hypothetical protein
MLRGGWRSLSAMTLVLSSVATTAAADELAAQATTALHQAVTFLREQVAVQGSYLWKYTPDLERRWGEDDATPTQGWVQAPGTPAVGLAFLRAYEATGDPAFLAAAHEVGQALVQTQLTSGGWWYFIEFDPEKRQAWCYRVDAMPDQPCEAPKDNEYRDATTFDDDTSQGALRFLMLLDMRLTRIEKVDKALREAIGYGLDRLIETQYPNGAYPVGSARKVADALTTSAWRAHYPSEWSRQYVEILERLFYTINDHVIRDMIRTFLLAHHLYGREEDLAAAMRAGDFLLAAQMPEPQRGWAHVYNRDLEPIWGRKFEPPGVVSNETGGAVQALLELYLHTNEDRYLEGAGDGVAWLDRSRLADGQWARFYELETNRPLYMTGEYELTYEPHDLPRRYAFQGSFEIPSTLAFYELLVEEGAAGARAALERDQLTSDEQKRLTTCMREEVAAIVGGLDADGRWIDDDMLRLEIYNRNVDRLATYVAAVDGRRLTVDTTISGIDPIAGGSSCART